MQQQKLAEPRPKPDSLSVRNAPAVRNRVPLRKRRRSNTGCLTGLLYFLFVVGISSLLAAFGWMAASEVLGFSRPAGLATVTIGQEDSISDIADNLLEHGLIETPWLFKLYANLSDALEEIVPGTYSIDTSLDYMAIVNAMKRDSIYRSEIKVTIPEGFTMKQIIARLSESGVCDEEELWSSARTYDFPYDFIEALPKTNNRLEGFLFPDTYDFYVGDDPVRVLRKMLSNFDSKLTKNMRTRAEEMGLSIMEAITIASMIEREAANADDAMNISSVIHNRLNHPDDYPWLEIDATIIYALPEHKAELTDADKLIDSPYNTYRYKGLPPGPICSPGRIAIEAALDPAQTGYYFYAMNKDGVHEFTTNLADHNKVVREAREAREAAGGG